MSYLEIAEKALRKAREAGRLPAPNAKRGYELNEKYEMNRQQNQEADDHQTCRIIERDLGLPAGTLALWLPGQGPFDRLGRFNSRWAGPTRL